MKKAVLVFLLAISLKSYSQDTFSILAFDSITREVGAAGASCVDLYPFTFPNDFICELFPDTGAIATQAAYIPANQSSARIRMRSGDNPQQLIVYMNQFDNGVAGAYATRQYGVVRMGSGFARAAAFTGTACMNYKNHIVGPNYTIHGNILLGQQVLDSMQAGFLREKGDLACKLMAAMRGAKMVGADSRCGGNNTSSLFAFLKVSQPTDTFGRPSFMVSLRTHDGDSIEPIDSLQILFSAARSCTVNTSGISKIPAGQSLKVGQDIARQLLNISWDQLPGATLQLIDASGRETCNQQCQSNSIIIPTANWAKGVYTLTVKSASLSEHRMIVIQ